MCYSACENCDQNHSCTEYMPNGCDCLCHMRTVEEWKELIKNGESHKPVTCDGNISASA